MLWSVLVRGALLANGLLALVALLVLLVCLLCYGKPVKGRRSGQEVAVLVLPVTLTAEPPRASAGPCSVMVAPLFLKFYRNIL